jgi:Na+-transporting NADH:ubiquinone oxidoreductase subunit A
MSRVVKFRKGINIDLKGAAEKVLIKSPLAKTYAVSPSDFAGLTPRLCVKQGDSVKAGSAVFFDKYKPEVVYVSPVSGTVSAINRGERRKLLEVVVTPDAEQVAETYTISPEILASRDKIIELMLQAGYWTFIKQRPYGIVANPADKPKAIFVSGFDTAPLSVDMDFVLMGQIENFQKGINILAKLTSGKVHLGLNSADASSKLNKITGAEITHYSGKHPASNVGIQIHHIAPISKGEIVWTVNPQHVAMLGHFFATGVYNAEKIVALCGSEVKRPHYMRMITGAGFSCFNDEIAKNHEVRYISGNILTGTNVGANGWLGFYDNQISIIPEGNHHEFLGWALPRLNKFSISKSYFSWLTPHKKYDLDTNLNGGERAFVVTNQYEKVLPMDLYPVYLLKAIMAGDIDKMEKLGIYEVIEEDLASCEFVCTSKINIQALVRQGIDMMIKEMS